MIKLIFLAVSLYLDSTIAGPPIPGKEWNYFGQFDQWNWGAVAEVCETGTRQSPIDIVAIETKYNTKLGEPKFDYKRNDSAIIQVYNNGKVVNSKFLGELYVSGAGLPGIYKAVGSHWHWGRQNYKGSEHLYSGRAYPLEVHVVTYNTKYADVTAAVNSSDGSALAVFGTVYQIHNDVTDKYLDEFINVFDQIKTKDTENKIDIAAFNLADMMSPDKSKYYRYEGSLTTPGCQEVVIWTNFVTPVKISEKQMEQFRELSAYEDGHNFVAIGDNYREVQPMQERTVLRSFEELSPLDKGETVYEIDITGSVATTTFSIPLLLLTSGLITRFVFASQ